jgi:hypothetical protein
VYQQNDAPRHWVYIIREFLDMHFPGLQPPAHVGSSLADFSTLKMEVICSSETSVYTKSTRRHIPEDGILHRITLYIQGSDRILKEITANTLD